MLQRVGKREHHSPEGDDPPRKCFRLKSSVKLDESLCFFCGHGAGTDGLHDMTTLQVDKHVREGAKLTGNTILFGKLSLGIYMQKCSKCIYITLYQVWCIYH